MIVVYGFAVIGAFACLGGIIQLYKNGMRHRAEKRWDRLTRK